jgi:Bacterial Ig-like domain (group 1)/Bacterial Ig domain
MKRTHLVGVLVALSLFAPCAQATLYLSDPFNNATGNLSGETGWTAASAQYQIIAGNLTVPTGLADPTVTTAARCQMQAGTAVNANRTFTGTAVTGGDVYLSFLLKVTTSFATGQGIRFLGLGNASGSAASSDGPTLALNAVDATHYQIGIRKSGSGTVTYPASGSYVSGASAETVFVVAKYHFTGVAANDTVTLWVNPASSTFNLVEPAATATDVAATTTGGAGSTAGLKYLNLSTATTAQAGVVELDDIRVGSVWGDVTPAGFTLTGVETFEDGTHSLPAYLSDIWSSAAGAMTIQTNNLTPPSGLAQGASAHPSHCQQGTINSGNATKAFSQTAITSGDAYVSFLFRQPVSMIAGQNYGFLGIGSAANSAAGSDGLSLRLKAASANSYQVGFKKGVKGLVLYPAAGTYTSGPNADALFIVAKYHFVGDSSLTPTNDTVTLWINPSASSFGGAEPTVGSTGIMATNDIADPSNGYPANQNGATNAANLLVINMNGPSAANGGTNDIDDLRVGTTWAAVTPVGPAVGVDNSLVSASSSSVAADGTATTTITVTVKDTTGAAMANQTVTPSVTGTANTVSKPALTDVNGVTTFTVSSTKAESKTISAVVGAYSAYTVTITQTASVIFTPGAIASYTVVATTPQTAGVPFNVVITALDGNGNVVTTDSSTAVTLVSDGHVQFDGNGNSTYGEAGDNVATLAAGTCTVSARDTVKESATITVSDANAKTGNTGSIIVNPGAAAGLTLESAADGSGAIIGTQNVAQNGTKSAFAIRRDGFGNFVDNATVAWSLINKTGSVVDGDLSPSSGPSATFTATHSGSAQIHADYNAGALTADSGVLTVIAAIDHYEVTATSPQTAGAVFVVTVTAKDSSGSTVNDSSTLVTLSSSGSLQVDADNNGVFGDTSLMLGNGVSAFHVKDTKAETIDITATDTTAKSGTLGGMVINPGAATRMVVTLPGQTFTAFTGNSGPVTAQNAAGAFDIVSLSAVDNFNNVDPSYSGSRTIAYSGPGGTPTYTTAVDFTAGQSTTPLATTLLKAETTTITATDGALIGVPSSSLVVNAGPFTKLQMVLPGQTATPGTAASGSGLSGTASTALTGQPFNVAVNAVDDNWNVAASTDTVTLTSSDGAASFAPSASAGLVAGTSTVAVTLNTAGSQTLTATDSTDGTKPAATSSVTAAVAEFRSQATGLWSDVNSWQVSLDGGESWSGATVPPTAANSTNIAIQAGHTLTVSSAVTVDDCVVQAGGQITVSGATLTLSGTGLDVFGVLKIADSTSSLISGDALTTLKFETGGKYSSALHTATAIPTATWEANSTCEIAPTAAGAAVPSNLGQAFANFNWNWPSQNGAVNLAGGLTNVTGDLTISSANVVRLFNAAGGNISDLVNVERIGGDFTLNGGTVYTFGTANNNATNTLYVGGNFTVAAGATLNCPNTGTNSASIIIFNGTGVQTFNDAGTINSTGVSQAGPASQFWFVNSGSTLVLNSLLPLVATTVNTPSRLIVNGALDIGTGGNVTGGSLSVSPGGLLYGTGTNAGPLLVSGTVAPGQGIGALNVGASMLNGGGTYTCEVQNTLSGQGVGWDMLKGSGNIGLAATSGNPFTVQARSLDGTGAAGSVTNFSPDASYSWLIASGRVTNFDGSVLALNTDSFSNDLAGGLFYLSTNSAGLLLNFANNHAPVAGDLAITRLAGNGFKLKISELLTNASDPDGDGVALLSIPTGSTNGLNNLSSDGTYIYYSPGASGDVTDAFSYTVRDSRAYRPGDTVRTATGTVVVNVVIGGIGQVQGVTPGSTAQVTFSGLAGLPYSVERSTNLTAWVSILLTNAPPGGLFQVSDDFSDLGGPPSAAFYRLRYAP